ncbi:MAG: hypothetical protein QMC19_03680 [Flavobacteriaceae bacterium]|jgi:hypothetical protein|tara:strand:- start:1924 stop:2505 length:582 start_codon:yes stop_codon:yes gene_type:complete
MKPLSLLVIFFLITINTYSQKTKKETLTISEQFDEVFRISTNYKENKVIRKTIFQNLRNNALDSIERIHKELQLKNQRNNFLKDSLQTIKKELGNLNSDLKLIINEKDTIYLFGIKLSKVIYKIIIWITVLLLIFMLSYSLYEYKNSFLVTSQAKKNLIDAENELSDLRKNSLKKEQKLRRLLQDEINKQKGI